VGPIRRINELYRMFLPGLGLKRWLAVVVLGLVQIGIAVILWSQDWLRRLQDVPPFNILTLRIFPRHLRGSVFLTTGALLTVFGWRRLIRSLMRLMLPERPEAGLGQLLMQRRRAEHGRRVVVIGGGPGLAPVIESLLSLQEEVRIDVLLSATEHGRITQELRDRFGLSGQQIIYPVVDDAVLYAELEDGTLLEGVATINRYSGARIKDLFMSRNIRRVQVWEPDDSRGAARLRDYMPSVAEAALEALARAELIVLAPGRIYTQVLPNLVLPRIAQAVRESSATKVFVPNLMTEPGKTDDWTVADHLDAIHRFSGVSVDYAILNQSPISNAMLAQYRNEGSSVVRMEPDEGMSRLIFADTGEETTLLEGAVIISADLITEKPQIVSFQRGDATILREMPVVRHDPAKLAPVFEQLLLQQLLVDTG
jgi:2-phospho-L-lactate transferase/gluconeogenesis factor (CofD/UPF0052 family)